MTKQEIIETLKKNKDKFCSVDEPITFLSSLPDNTTLEQAIDLAPDNKRSMWAYYWALYIGNRDIMIDKVNKRSMWAYYWALYIGNRDIMINRVVESRYALEWAIDIGDEDVMITRMNETDLNNYKLLKKKQK
jgi:hypothetical protein